MIHFTQLPIDQADVLGGFHRNKNVAVIFLQCN